VIAIGQHGAIIANAAKHAGLQKSDAVNSTTEAAKVLADVVAPGDLVLIKGSRAAQTERVIDEFRQHQKAEGVRR
jgi:UDP-N-acetylmuramyl pentapeptide synthase